MWAPQLWLRCLLGRLLGAHVALGWSWGGHSPPEDACEVAQLLLNAGSVVVFGIVLSHG